jgi:hypothetical protein
MEKIETVTVTQGLNGYPENTYRVVIADTFTELEQLQAQLGGEIVMLKKRAGWKMWENMGNHYGNLLNMKEDDSDKVICYRIGNDIEKIAIEAVIGDYSSASEALADICPHADIEQAMVVLKAWQERIDEIIDTVIEGEPCDIWMANPNHTNIDYVVDGESVGYTTDVWTYRLALKN